jgi:RNA polymerase sigma-70 factor (ECF subfamily)
VERGPQADREAVSVLARAAAARLDAAARLITRDREIARDAVQEALTRAWRDLPGLRDPDRFGAWLHRLTVNAAIDEHRRRRRRVIEVAADPINHAAPQDAFAVLADRDALDQALGRLAPEHRALVVLHYYLGMPLPEAATSLGISLSAAKSRLHRSMLSLRSAFGLGDRTTSEVPEPVRGGPA